MLHILKHSKTNLHLQRRIVTLPELELLGLWLVLPAGDIRELCLKMFQTSVLDYGIVVLPPVPSKPLNNDDIWASGSASASASASALVRVIA